MKRLLSVLLWSAIAAAFIGPGTVATAAAAGAGHRYALLWALLFSTVTTFVLQEASARLTVVSGRDLASALRDWAGGRWMVLLMIGGVVIGCAAYEAGNILGGVSGVILALPGSRELWTLATGAVAALLLLAGSPRATARSLSLLVAVMGVAFLVAAIRLEPPLGELARGALLPRLPAGSGLLVLGLIGTTVVPYNLFLGSGLARGQSLGELRFGLAVAVGLGGLISMAVLVAGAAVEGHLSFAAVADVLQDRLGRGARSLFAWGLFAAGLSSAVTAPLAAAITARGAFGGEGWQERGGRFRAVWGGVLAVGLLFGLSGIRPVPVILVAQALNGVLLPLVAIFLLLAVNDRRLMGERGLNGPVSNLVLALVVAVACVLGVSLLLRAVTSATALPAPNEQVILIAAGGLLAVVGWPLYRAVRRRRQVT
ncbi:MAG: Nramp family divalent metal transporter [Acidobacteriota bacterium]